MAVVKNQQLPWPSIICKKDEVVFAVLDVAIAGTSDLPHNHLLPYKCLELKHMANREALKTTFPCKIKKNSSNWGFACFLLKIFGCFVLKQFLTLTFVNFANPTPSPVQISNFHTTMKLAAICRPKQTSTPTRLMWDLYINQMNVVCHICMQSCGPEVYAPASPYSKSPSNLLCFFNSTQHQIE